MRLALAVFFVSVLALAKGCSDAHDHNSHAHADTASAMDMGSSMTMAPGDSCTDTSHSICVGTQISHCDGSVYGALEDCAEGDECMTMSDGMTHCMTMGGM